MRGWYKRLPLWTRRPWSQQQVRSGTPAAPSHCTGAPLSKRDAHGRVMRLATKVVLRPSVGSGCFLAVVRLPSSYKDDLYLLGGGFPGLLGGGSPGGGDLSNAAALM